MGASTFHVTAKGRDVAEAFRSAVDQAQWEHGHGGYSGTIAEKHECVLYALPAGVTVDQFAAAVSALLYDDESQVDHLWTQRMPHFQRAARQYDDKWGPAVAFKIADETFAFVGYASS